jgi:signal transduction histidine kinase
MAIPRQNQRGRSPFARANRKGIIVQHPAVESARAAESARAEVDMAILAVLESRLRDEARLEGVQLAAREMAHLLNNDLAVAVGLVDLLQARLDMPPHLIDLLDDAVSSLDAAARHIEQLQDVVRVVVKETPAGASLDLERSRR